MTNFRYFMQCAVPMPLEHAFCFCFRFNLQTDWGGWRELRVALRPALVILLFFARCLFVSYSDFTFEVLHKMSASEFIHKWNCDDAPFLRVYLYTRFTTGFLIVDSDFEKQKSWEFISLLIRSLQNPFCKMTKWVTQHLLRRRKKCKAAMQHQIGLQRTAFQNYKRNTN